MKQNLLRIFFLLQVIVVAQGGHHCIASGLLKSFRITEEANVKITGTVVDESGAPMPGVSVVVKGSSLGTSTDGDGKFTLNVPENSTLIFQFIGYSKQEINIGNSTKINVQMKPEEHSLNEVLVVGYGTQKRREVTGAITKINSAEITALPTPSFEASLQGRAPGVQVTQGSGLAGSGSVVRIRGTASISAGGDPLYVVDGIPVTQDPFLNSNRGAMNQNPLAALNPNDIESIEVLKDAGAAGIYGSRGSNGVVLITTKKGKEGKPVFNFTTRLGLSNASIKPEFISGSEWLQLRQEAWENDGNTGLAPLPNGLSWDLASKTNTDWWNETTETGIQNDNNLSFTYGTKKYKAYLGANYSKDNSYLKGNSYSRAGAKVSFEYKILDNLNATLNGSFTRGQNNRVAAAWSGGLGDAMSTALPIYPVYNADGSFFSLGANPVRQREGTIWRTVDLRSVAALSLNYSPIKDLTFTFNGGLDYLDIKEDKYQNAELVGRAPTEQGRAERWPTYVSNWNNSLVGSYNWNPNEQNKLTGTIGIEAQKSTRRNATVTQDFADGPLYEYNGNMEDDPTILGLNSRIGDQWTFVSYFGRINYTYNNRYVIQALARVDGSSKFGRNYRYGFFPAISGAWIISEEDFLKSITFIDVLKLRASFGVTGNSNLPFNEWRGTYATPDVLPLYNDNPVTAPTRLENPNLKWETSNNFDIGLDYSLLNARITGELSYYNKLSKDVLINRNLPLSTGWATYWQNIGKIKNYGIEFSINTVNIKTADFSWSTNFNISSLNNKVIDLRDLSSDAVGGGTNDTRVVEGYPVGTNYLVRYYGTDPTDGLPIWLDKDGNKTKTFSLDHRVVTGKVAPDAFGGFNNTFKYKLFELGVLFNFSFGGNIYDGSAKRQMGVVTDWTMRSEIGDRWRKPGDDTRFPRLTMQTGTYDGLSSEWQYNSTLFLYDASYVRLRELTLSYNLPADFQKRMGINSAKVYITGFNILTFTKYPGGDPEIARDFENAQDRNMSPNITYLTPPQQKSWTLGINIGF
ncbi:TonB-dependent receptor [Solitalea sp. MAHUQ-68]|uniref:TonB-dependent receptor n=1 Tax=Solitalea agri TaxID=2953739 RepID=A0A9X2F418_9SPHI|nr:TonB-dependent receptor [Solitalea agri]MCO4294389.1 TonB-dependent receptor [Solitalea agri]